MTHEAEAFTAPESNLWSDFQWPEWVPQEQRELIEKFWSPAAHRGPKDWLANGATEFRYLGVRNGSTVRSWTWNNRLVTGQILHRWNNIFVVIGHDACPHMFDSIATDESIEVQRARLSATRAKLDEELQALAPEATP